MNDNLPIHVQEMQGDGVITYANEVIAIIAGMAVNEVDGVASMINTNAIADLFSRGKPITKGVKVEVGIEEASVDLMLTVEYGKPIQKVCTEVQENVRKAIESMTGLHVVKVDVHVMGVSFEREAKEIEQGYVKATSSQKALDDNVSGFIPLETKGAQLKKTAEKSEPEFKEGDIHAAIEKEDDEPFDEDGEGGFFKPDDLSKDAEEPED